MSKRDAKLLVDDKLASVAKIETYVDSKTFDAFKKDEKTIDAVVRNLEIIGEAANHLPTSARHKSENIKWHRIIGLCNRIIHEYFGVDLNIIWRVIQTEMSGLELELQSLREKI